MRHFDQTLIQATLEISASQRIEFIKELAYTVGCFILPKYMMKAYEAEVPEVEDGLRIIPTHLTNYFAEVMNELYQGMPHENYGVSHDYFHTLRNVSLEDRKSRTLETYKLIFRFSIEKLTKFLAEDSFLLILLQYLKESKMQRIHQRTVLAKNKAAYYRALENMFNFSEKNQQVYNIIQ